MRMVLLQPVAMITPQIGCSPVLEFAKSNLARVISEPVFLEKYTGSARAVNVNGQMTTTYRDVDNLLYIVAGTFD